MSKKYIEDALKDCVCSHQKIQHDKEGQCMVGSLDPTQKCYCTGWVEV